MEQTVLEKKLLEKTVLEEKLEYHVKNLYNLARQDMIKFILTAMVLVSGMAWNSFITSSIEYHFPDVKNGLVHKFLYAFGFSLLSIIIIVIVFKKAYSPKLPFP